MKLEKKKRLFKKYGIEINLLDEFYDRIHVHRTLITRRLVLDGKHQSFVGGYMAVAKDKVFINIVGDKVRVRNMTMEDWALCAYNEGFGWGGAEGNVEYKRLEALRKNKAKRLVMINIIMENLDSVSDLTLEILSESIKQAKEDDKHE